MDLFYYSSVVHQLCYRLLLIVKMLNKRFIILALFGAICILDIVKATRDKKSSGDINDPDHIWQTFYAKDNKNKKSVAYQIRNIPEKRFPEAVQLMVDHYLTSEPIHVVRGMYCVFLTAS